MGGVCCKDGVDGSQKQQAPAQQVAHQTPVGNVSVPGVASQPVVAQKENARPAAEERAGPTHLPSTAFPGAASTGVVDPAHISLSHEVQKHAPAASPEAIPAARTASPTAPAAPPAKPPEAAPAPSSPGTAPGAIPAVAPAASPAAAGAADGPGVAGPEPSGPSVLRVRGPRLHPVPSAERISASTDAVPSGVLHSPPSADMVPPSTASNVPGFLLDEARGSTIGAGGGAGAAVQKVMVETRRRPGHADGGGGGGDGSSSVSHSHTHSESNSAQPGSSAQRAGLSSPHGAGSVDTVTGPPSIVDSSAARGAASATGSGTYTASLASSNTPAPRDASTGFMFGAPRAKKEHKRERRKEAARPKSLSSTDASGDKALAGGDVTPGSKRSAGEGSSGPSAGTTAVGVPGSSAAVPAMGSSITHSLGSSDAAGSSIVPGRGFGPGGSYVPGSSVGTGGGSTGGRRLRVKGSRAVRGDTSSSASASASGGRGGSDLLADRVPPAVPEEEAQEGEEEGEGEAEAEGDGSPRSSSEHLSIMSPPEGSDVENVLQLICNIFQIPVALVAAYRSSNIFIRSTAIKLTDDDQWRYSLAQWSMLNAHDLKDVLMVPDATKDERFREYYCVRQTPRVRFFMASPLRSSTGELLGTLCMADFTEKGLEPANLLVVNNLQTLVIRQLERDMALAQERLENEVATEQLQQEMMRALDHLEKCIMFIDTSKPGWEVLYANMAWEQITGVPRVHVLGRPLHDFFMALGGAALDWSSAATELASLEEFTVHRVAVRQKPDKLVSLHLRMATSQAAGELEGLLPKGLPAWVKSRGTEAHNYFVFVEEVDKQAGGSSTVYEALAKHVEKVRGLELSHLLGKGGFGSVYYGTWNGLPVAVKMIDNRLTKTNTEGISLEALMGQELTHPNIVKTIKYVMRNALGASSMSGSNSRGTGSATRNALHSRNALITSRNGELLTSSSAAAAAGGVIAYPPPPGGGGAAAAGGSGSAAAVRVTRGSGGPSGAGARGVLVPLGGGAAGNIAPYITSAQPGLSGMTSAQIAAAQDLTSASGMVHMAHMLGTMGSDATTVMGGGSLYSGGCGDLTAGGSSGLAGAAGTVRAGGGVPPRAHNLVGSAGAGPVAAAARGGAGSVDGGGATTGTSTATSGMTAVGPASIPASSASTVAGPPSISSAGGVPANMGSPQVLSRDASYSVPRVAGGAAGSAAHAPTPGTAPPPPYFNSAGAFVPPVGGRALTSPASPRPPQAPAMNSAGSQRLRGLGGRGSGGSFGSPPPLRDPSAAAAVADEAAAAAAAPGAAGLTADQQTAAMTSRFSLAFSTITSNGDVLVPGKGSPSSSSGHTQSMPPGTSGSGEDSGEVWIIMEFCDRGSLQDALDRGALKLRKPGGELGETHLPMMIATACEVASALQYLHDKGIVHGDLTAWNVMLCTAAVDRSGRNFTAKVADFGLSRTLDVKSKIKTRTYGTISHMPPECLISGIISKATDVFAFGVLLWQMYTGLRPWAGMNHGQIIYNVGMKNVQLLFPPGTPPAIADLSGSCTRTDPASRPSFGEIMDKLGSVRISLGL